MLIERAFNAVSPVAQNIKDSTDRATTVSSDFISLKDNKTIYRIAHKDISYIQSWGNYLKFFVQGQKVKIVRKTIKAVESELPPDQFLRIHKSYIVNINHIIALEGNLIKLDNQQLPIGKSYLVNVKKTITG